MNKFLFKQIDNIGLVLFRIVFGALIAIEGFGAIATGWVRRTLIEPDFTFNFIGFDFLQPLPGNGMYFYFAIMGILGICIMLGYKYRWTMLGFTLMWTSVYLMQKSSYNNHYYLLILLSAIMAILPAHRWFSLDAKLNPSIKSLSMPQWCKWVIILQVFIVFTYGSIAKMYPDWLDGTVPALFMKGKKDYWLIGELLQQQWAHYTIAYFGLIFDLLIIPMLLWKRTRLVGFYISIFFHLFNSIVFQIGIFPYMSIAFAFFFFSEKTLQKQFFPKKQLYIEGEIKIPSYKKPLLILLSTYFIIQLALPLRHWFIKDDVLWTEEGHRLSWRMMLRTKSAIISVYTKDKNNKNAPKKLYNYGKILSKKQRRSFRTKPDMIWQLAQKIKQIEAEKGVDIAVYIKSRVKVNGGEYHLLLSPNIDLASEEWNVFKHNTWLEPSPDDYHEQ